MIKQLSLQELERVLEGRPFRLDRCAGEDDEREVFHIGGEHMPLVLCKTISNRSTVTKL